MTSRLRPRFAKIAQCTTGHTIILVVSRSHFHAHAASRLYLLALSTDAPFGILNLAWSVKKRFHNTCMYYWPANMQLLHSNCTDIDKQISDVFDVVTRSLCLH